MNKHFYFLLLALFAISCGSDSLVLLSEEAPEEGWKREWKPEFEFEIKDSTQHYDTFIDLRHTSEYPYSNLYLFMDLFKDGKLLDRDTVECPLAATDGKWLGKGLGFIYADRFDAHVLYRFNRRFPGPGTYTMRLEQAMRRETLEGILDVGISVEIVDP